MICLLRYEISRPFSDRLILFVIPALTCQANDLYYGSARPFGRQAAGSETLADP